MKRRVGQLLALALLAWLLQGCRSGEPDSSGVLWRCACEPESAGVGDLIGLRIVGQWPDSLGQTHLRWQASTDTLLLVGSDSTNLSAPEGWTGRRYDLALVVPRAGRFMIPPPALVSALGETLALAEAGEISISGRVDPDPQASLRPLAPMASLRDFPWRAAALVAALVVSLAAVLFWWYRRTAAIEGAPELPPVPPEVEFREGLARIMRLNLAQQGRMRAFVQELSWVFRRYLGRRWKQPALEATRPEILRWLPGTDFPVRDQQEVAAWLEETDRIKFAGQMPLFAGAESLTKRAEQMVSRSEEIAAEERRRRIAAEAGENVGSQGTTNGQRRPLEAAGGGISDAGNQVGVEPEDGQ